MSVIDVTNATRDPPTDPLTPATIPFNLAQLRKSETIKK
jgi:hypothetical protein